MSTPEEIQAEANGLIEWYKGLSDETKNYWTFRWTRMEDPAYEILYATMKAAEKLCRSERAAQKKAKKGSNHGQRPESV